MLALSLKEELKTSYNFTVFIILDITSSEKMLTDNRPNLTASQTGKNFFA